MTAAPAEARARRFAATLTGSRLRSVRSARTQRTMAPDLRDRDTPRSEESMPFEPCVVTLTGTTRRDHERVAHAALAERLAALLGRAFAGEYDAHAGHAGHVYFVPDETLLLDRARELRIAGPCDLFGGVVPDRVVATKAITHGTIDGDDAPDGWRPQLAERLREVVLDGYTAFSADAALSAGKRLLEQGAVRVKPAHLLGGAGQTVASNAQELGAALSALDARALRDHGVVLEQNIDAPRVFSVGEVRVAGLDIAYYGTQREVANHAGEQVYGGSDLHIVRGGIAGLLDLGLAAELRLAVVQTLAYDAAVREAFPDFFASRRNYDVLQGRDSTGREVSGVLEQSWRIGGASPAEIAALRAFAADPALQSVHASSHEVYTPPHVAPPEAEVLYDGTDAHAGRLLKYSVVESVSRRGEEA